ncbi:MAG: ribonuclease HI family protein [Candidatus Portnoybacteria bacterium]|nr:ribonuclease HI family protein [Candidatus Portnoybacteria bacterium]
MKITIYTDGGARNNPGPAAVGVVIKREKEILGEYNEFIGEATNNEAEYQAIIFALKKAKLLFGKKKIKEIEIELYSDSELAIKQLNHEYKIKEANLQLLFIEVWNLTLDFKQVNFKHVLRDKNKEADKLVNQALDAEERTQTLL